MSLSHEKIVMATKPMSPNLSTKQMIGRTVRASKVFPTIYDHVVDTISQDKPETFSMDQLKADLLIGRATGMQQDIAALEKSGSAEITGSQAFKSLKARVQGCTKSMLADAEKLKGGC